MTKNDLHNPLVSIIMPVYNAEDFLIEAINSIITQTYRNWELICVDDGSTDRSWEILDLFAELDERIKVIRFTQNRGLTYALNRALALSTGKYIARMDSDDISLPKRIEEQVNFLNNNSDVVAVGTQCELIDEAKRVIGRKMFPTKSDQLYKMMFEVMPMQHPTIMVRGDIFRKVGYENQPTAEDVSLFFRLLQHGDFSNIDKVLFQYRIRRNSNSLKDIKKTFTITVKTRLRAVKEWGYKPTKYSLLLNLVQLLIVNLLPSYVVLAIYESVRFSRPLIDTIRDDAFIPMLAKVGITFRDQ